MSVRNVAKKRALKKSLKMNASDLIPIIPDVPPRPKKNVLSVVKNVLLCFILFGGLLMIVDKLTDHMLKKSHEINDECEDKEDVLQHEKFVRNTLYSEQNVEGMKLDRCTVNLMKKDIMYLKNQIMTAREVNNRDGDSGMYDAREIDDKIRAVILESNAIDMKIKKALDTYDADKLALYDYAAEYAGGQIIEIPDTTAYPSNHIIQFFGFFKMTYSSSPKEILRPGTLPGDCFRFYGNKARIIIKLGKEIAVGSVSLEHSPVVEDYSAAPKDFNVYGLSDESGSKRVLLGSFVYDISKQDPLQTFPVKTSFMSNANRVGFVELEVLSNNGNEESTSIYRFRVHAEKNKK